MTADDYKAALDAAFLKLGNLDEQREEIELEISKLNQFIQATVNMLSPEEQGAYMAKWEVGIRAVGRRQAGLADAIRAVLLKSGRQYRTVAYVRDRLVESGFDFSQYVSNPLASVSTTLKRMYPKEVDSIQIEGVTGYRLKRKAAFSAALRKHRKLAELWQRELESSSEERS